MIEELMRELKRKGIKIDNHKVDYVDNYRNSRLKDRRRGYAVTKRRNKDV